MKNKQANKCLVIYLKYKIPVYPSLRKNLKSQPLNQKSTHVHYEVLVKTEGVLGKGFRQDVGVLVLRFYVRDVELSILDMLSQKVVTHIDVFRLQVGHGVDRHLDRTLVILKNLDAQIPKTRQ